MRRTGRAWFWRGFEGIGEPIPNRLSDLAGGGYSMGDMQPKSDAQLLREYAEQRAEGAFAELVARHTNLVYSAALRQVESVDLAAEVSQQVFIGLARSAHTLSVKLTEGASLAGWLCRSARNLSLNLRRDEFRRHSRERQAMAHLDSPDDPSPDWAVLRPALDAAMSELSDADYDAIVLRYFKNQDLRAVGQALGVTDDTAQKRVSRALEKLHDILSRRGVTTSTASLSLALSANAVQAAPIGLTATISTAATALAGTTVSTSIAITATKTIAMTTLQKTLVGITLVAAIGTGIYEAHQASQLRGQIQTLQEQQAPLAEQIAQLQRERDDAMSRLASRAIRPSPRLPAPRVSVVTTAAAVPPTNALARMLMGGDAPKLTAQQVESYLKDNQRNATSLLAAFRSTGDAALLQEAMEKFPGDSQVAFEAAFRKDASPDERRQWLDALKSSAPQNALADYLSAADHFKAGRSDQALQDLIAASGKSQFQDFTPERMQDDEEAYRAAGFPMAEAKTIPAAQLLLPQLAEMKVMSQSLTDLALSYRQAGDETSAQAVLQMAAGLGQRYSIGFPGVPEISQLVGIVIERSALGQMDANSSYGGGQTVKDRLGQLAQQEAEVKELFQQTEALWSRMSPEDFISYKDRWRNFGEVAAGRWLINKYGQK